MSSSAKKRSPWPKYQELGSDGRRERSGRSRRRIIEAMFELMREGDMNPTAVAVAARAEVGLRTVFRHFEDMESIFEEMTEELSAITMPQIVAPFQSTTWKEQLLELADRNSDLYERVFPMQVALIIRRFQSDFLQRQYNREVNLLRSSIKAILPKKVARDKARFAMLEVVMTFATWRRLREDQNLSVTDAKKALRLAVLSLIEDIDID